MKEYKILIETKKDTIDEVMKLLEVANAFCIISIKDLNGNIEFKQERELIEHYKYKY